MSSRPTQRDLNSNNNHSTHSPSFDASKAKTVMDNNSNSSAPSVLGKTHAPHRDRIQQVLFDCFKTHGDIDATYATKLAFNIESALYDHFGDNRSDYTSQARLILSNFKDPKNPLFRLSITTGAVEPSDLPTMTVHDMASDEMKKERQTLIKYELEARKTDYGGGEGVDMFPCPKCHAKKTSYFQKQTRSADEPMTIFCRCMVCNQNWRIYP